MYMVSEGELAVTLLSSLVSLVPSLVISLLSYVLTALAIYTIAKRRGLNKPWLAWIPVVDVWLLGSLSDQYQYVVRGRNRSKRKSLLVLGILSFVLGIAVIILAISLLTQLVLADMQGVSEEYLLDLIMGPLLSMLGLCLPMAGIGIAYTILYYMALYDVYKSLDPSNCVLYLVLSILISVTLPFFLFFNRNKDGGMPPRKQEPAAIPPQYTQYSAPQDSAPQDSSSAREPWEDNSKDYL